MDAVFISFSLILNASYAYFAAALPTFPILPKKHAVFYKKAFKGPLAT